MYSFVYKVPDDHGKSRQLQHMDLSCTPNYGMTLMCSRCWIYYMALLSDCELRIVNVSQPFTLSVFVGPGRQTEKG